MKHFMEREQRPIPYSTLLGSCVVAIVLGCCWAATSQVMAAGEKVPSDQYVRLLEMIASQVRGNFESIRSASGTIDVVEMVRDRDPQVPNQTKSDPPPAPGLRINVPHQTLKGDFFVEEPVSVRFAFDQSTDRLFTSYQQQGGRSYRNTETGKVHAVSGLPVFHQETILTPEHYLHHRPNARVLQLEGTGKLPVRDRRGHRIVYRDAPSEAELYQRLSYVVDPRDLFKYSTMFFHEHHERNAKAIRAGTDLPIVIWKLPGDSRYAIDRLYYSNSKARTGEAKVTQVVDGSVGFNTVEATLDVTGSASEEVTWSYERHGEIYFPSDFRMRKYDSAHELTYERKMKFVETELNQPIAEETFTQQQFTLADGDRLMDRIENKVALYHDGDAVRPEEFVKRISSVAVQPRTSWVWFRWALILVVAGVSIGCIILAVRKRE